MPLVPLKIPAGFHGNGTDYEESGKWIDGSLVRWMDGSLRPIGGWREREEDVTRSPIRGMHTWQDNDTNAWIAAGSFQDLVAITAGGTVYDLTPTNIFGYEDGPSGRIDAAASTGYGAGVYGVGYYNLPIEVDADSIPEPATTWAIDNFGENLVAVHSDEGSLLQWDLAVSSSDLLTNGGFETDSDWTKGYGWSIDTASLGRAIFEPYQETIFYSTFGDHPTQAQADLKEWINVGYQHPMVVGDTVYYSKGSLFGDQWVDMPPLVSGTTYHVVDDSGNYIKIATTAGGTPIVFDQRKEATDVNPQLGGDINYTTNTITSTAHGFSNGDTVVYAKYNVSGGNSKGYINGLDETYMEQEAPDQLYYIINATTDTFQLSLTSGGTAVNMTAPKQVTIDATDSSVVDVANDTIYAANTFTERERVRYDAGGAGNEIGGLTHNDWYYVYNVTSTSFQLMRLNWSTVVPKPFSALGLTSGQTFTTDIDATGHHIKQNVANKHTFTKAGVGNLSQTVTGLTNTSNAQDTHKFSCWLRPENGQSVNATTARVPSTKIKITGTTSGTVLLNETLKFGHNDFKFDTDDTSVSFEFVPTAPDDLPVRIYSTSLKYTPIAAPVANAPTDNSSVVVTEERFVFCLGAGGNPRKVQWCDREDISTWTAAATNEAGDIELQTNGQIMCGVQTRGTTLILTDTDAHQAQYIGPPYVYSFQRAGTQCGAISKKAASSTDMGAFWFGIENFHYFDGNSVRILPCDVHDKVFKNINTAQQSKIWSVVNGAHSEVWWVYPSANSDECDKYVAYNYVDNHWLIGDLERTSGTSRGVFAYPIMAKRKTEIVYDNAPDINYSGQEAYRYYPADIFDHEVGHLHDGASVYAETGPISLGAGEQIMKVNKIIPDEKTQGDVQLTFKTRFHPNDTERSYGPYDPSNPTSVRFSGRQVRVRVEQDQLVDWRVGTMRLETKSGGNR